MSNLYCSLSYQSSCNDRDLCLSSHSKVLRTRLVITLYHDIFQPVRRKTQCKGLQKIFRKKFPISLALLSVVALGDTVTCSAKLKKLNRNHKLQMQHQPSSSPAVGYFKACESQN